MTKDETLKVIYVIQSTYPHHYKGFSDHESRALLEAWTAVLADYDYLTVSAGLKAYLANDKAGFPPSPGQIIEHITKITARPEEKIGEGEAWQMVYKAISRSIYYAAEEFAKLPEIIQKSVGSPEVLKQWAVVDEETVPVIQSQFLRAFRISQERHTEERKLPQSVKALADKLAGRLAIERKDDE